MQNMAHLVDVLIRKWCLALTAVSTVSGGTARSLQLIVLTHSIARGKFLKYCSIEKCSGETLQGSFALIRWKVRRLDRDVTCSRWSMEQFEVATQCWWACGCVGRIEHGSCIHLASCKLLIDMFRCSHLRLKAAFLWFVVFDLVAQHDCLQPEQWDDSLSRCLCLHLALVEAFLQFGRVTFLDLEYFFPPLNCLLSVS